VKPTVEGRPLEDPDLVVAAKNGDVGAYEKLVAMYQRIAFRTAYLITRSEAEAEDAAQEGFVKAYYALGRFRSGAPFKPWLLRIVANEARNRMRSAGRREGLALKAAAVRPSGEAAPSPEVAALQSDEGRRLLEVLDAMPEPDRIVISLRYFLDLTEAEMAEVLGTARGTVKSRLSRAMARLREMLQDEDLETAEERGTR
jgi:RNA polymerase sigma-70 factor (ECF subfamily)